MSKPYYPCGLIADSHFNDSVSFSGPIDFSFSTNGIAWPSDVNELFRSTAYTPGEALPPPSWSGYYKDLFLNQSSNWPMNQSIISTDEHLMNWMRVSAFPNFLKLYGIIKWDHSSGNSLMEKVNLSISDCFPIGSAFGGTKSIVISSGSFLTGGKQLGLALIFLICGSILLLIAISIIFFGKNFSPQRDELIEAKMFLILEKHTKGIM